MIGILFTIENTLNNRILGAPRHWLAGIVRSRLPLLVIAGTLLLSAGLAYKASPTLLMLVLVSLPAVGALMAFVHWPPLGLIALIVACLILPSPNFPGGFNLAVLFLGLLIGLWLLDMILGRGEIRLVSSRPVWPLLALVLVAVLAFGVGQLPWFSFAHQAPLDTQLGALSIFVFAAGAFLLVAHQVRDLRWLQWMTWVFVGLGAAFVAGWVVPGVGGITSRLFQLGATSNSMFWTWLAAISFSQAYINRTLHLRWRLILAAIAALTIFVAFFLNRDWKSGYLPAVAAMAIIVALRSWRTGLVMLLAGPFLAYYLSSQAVATDEYSYSTRLDAWTILLNMVKVNPILGFGPANYYWYTPLFRIRGWAVEFNSHSQIVDLLAQTGLLGLGCFVWLVAEIGWLGWRLRNLAPTGFAQAYVYGVLGGLGGTVVAATLADWVLPFVYNIGLNGFRGSILAWLFLGGLVSIEQMLRHQVQPQASAYT
jgi:hypothetical protein